MELRCAWRSTNISETSRFGYSIGYIRRLVGISSTENAQCGVLTPLESSIKHRLGTMLHRPGNIMRTVAFSAVFLATGLAPALAADPTGDWRVADGVANIRVAECNGNMWGAVAWEKTPGGRDSNNPDVSKQSRPTLGMPILIDMKKKPARRSMGRPSLQRQGRPDVQPRRSSRSAPIRWRFKAACSASSAAARPGPASRARFPQAPPTAWPRARRRARERRPSDRAAAPRNHPPRAKTTGAVSPAPKPGQKQAAGQPGDIGDICLLPDIARFAH